MWNSKHLIAGIGITAIATALLSFTDGDDEGKKKKYHVIHQKDGEMMEFDTILPMSSSYTVEQFLSDKGINDENVNIINVPAHGHGMMFSGQDGEQQVFIRSFDENITIDDEGGERQEVKIIREENEKGEVVLKKFVNGEEVELSEEEKARMQHHGDHHEMRMHMHDHEGEGEQNVELKVEVDKDGNMVVKKFVDGKEVEVTEEEMNQIQMHHEQHGDQDHVRVMVIEDGDHPDMEWHGKDGDEQVELKVEVDKDGNMTVQKFVNGEEVEVTEEEMEQIQMRHEQMGDRQMIFIEEGTPGEEIHIEMLEGEIDSLLQEMEFNIETIMEESGEDGTQRVIIKQIEMDDENAWQEEGGEMHKEIRVQHHMDVDSDEDFTVVLVTENIDEGAEMETIIRTERPNSMEMNEPISVYPNPNNGTFTIAFNQKEALKTAIKVVDAQGKIVYKEKLGTFSGSYKKELDLRQHGTGVYIVNVEQGDEVSARKVIVE